MNRITSPLQLGNSGPAVADLQIGLRFLIDTGFFGSGMPDLSAEAAQSFYGDATKESVETFQKIVGLNTDGIVNAATATALNNRLTGLDSARRIVGRVTFVDGRPAKGVTLRILRRDFGGKDTLLHETRTTSDGNYAFTIAGDSADAVLNIAAVRSTGKEVPLPAQLNYLDGAASVTRDLVVPQDLAPVPDPEFRRLAADLAGLHSQLVDLSELAVAREDAERQDLTVLSRDSHWDARLVTKLWEAAGLSAEPETPTSPEALYGLLRAGLPSSKLQLAQVSPEIVKSTLETMREAGVIGLDDTEIKAFHDEFVRFRSTTLRSLPVPGGNTTYGRMLDATGLSSTTDFESVYFNHTGTDAELWQKALNAGLQDREVGLLQRQGKLAFLSAGSLEMTTHLMALEAGTDGPAADLANQGLYTTEQWKAELEQAAGGPNGDVQPIIPAAYTGSPEHRKEAYARDLAHKVRAAAPMHVLAHRIANDHDDGFGLGAAREPAARLLRQAAGQGLQFGRTPLADFLNTHPGAADGLTDDEVAIARTTLLDLQRTYQISTSDDVMMKMRQAGLKAAHDVTSMSRDDFLAVHGGLFPSPQEAGLVYAKAEQVSSMVYNLFAIASRIESDVVVYGASAPAEVRQSVKNELVKHFPTLTSLFGSQDFCDCEHCRSVLSPAAYLVDLLQFVEGEDVAREGFEGRWAERHGGQPYSAQYVRPFDALVERRPDLIHIPLTCENIHTALPYIDIVNEILEYFVAKGKLDGAAARDTGGATTAELLAEPQNVIREAYDVLRGARYPLSLPFDQPLETVRAFADHFETPLAAVLEAFRPGGKAFNPNQPLDERAAIFIESLGLSPAEFAIFTDPDPLVDGKWYGLYGLAAAGPAIANPTNQQPSAKLTLPKDNVPFAVGDLVTYLDVSEQKVHGDALTIKEIGAADAVIVGRTQVVFDGRWTTPPVRDDQLIVAVPRSAKTLADRLGVTYQELVTIVKTGFVNPRLASLTLLYKLGMTVQDAFFYDDKSAFYEDNRDLLDEDLKPEKLSPANKKRYDALSSRDPITRQTGWEVLGAVQAIVDRLAAASAEFAPFDARAWLEKALDDKEFDDVLVLADPDAGCSFDATTLRYADGRTAADIDFLRINLFVRLWRKLGWTIEETDRALTTFTPRNAPFDAGHLDQQPLRTALIYLAHFKALLAKLPIGRDARLKLLTLWSDIATTGEKPLYAQLFLTRSVLNSDPAFDDPLGQYLTQFTVDQTDVEPGDELDPNDFSGNTDLSVHYDPVSKVQRLVYKGILTDAEKVQIQALAPGSLLLASLLDRVQATSRLASHLLILQGALGLTAGEIAEIMADAGETIETADLSLANVSLLYRYGLLAKGLKLSVSELIALKELSGLDPFAPLLSNPPATLEDDHPFSQTLRFVEAAGEVKDSGLKVEDLDYLLRHRFDPTGKYRPDEAGTQTLLKTLADGIRAIRTEHAVPADPAALGEEVLRQELGLILPADVAATLLAMLNGTAEFTAVIGLAEAEKLNLTTFQDAPAIVGVSYNTVRGEQSLTYRGILLDNQQPALEGQFNGPLSSVQRDALHELLTGVRAAAQAFFDKHLLKQGTDSPPAFGFLEDSDFQILFTPLPEIKDDLTEAEKEAARKANEELKRNKFARLERAFFPFLQARLIRQLILQTLTAHTGADPVLIESLVTDVRLLGATRATGNSPLLDAFFALGERGLDAAFFDRGDLGGAPQPAAPIVASADTALKVKLDSSGNLLNPSGSARFQGLLEVPAAGDYRFFAVLDNAGAKAVLRFDHLTNPVLLDGTAAQAGEGPEAFLELEPGLPYNFTLEVTDLGSGRARLLVQGETLPKGPLGQLTLYPATAVQGAKEALLLLTKALQLLQAVGLSEREARYVLTHAADFGNVNLSELPTARIGDTDPEKQEAVKRFEAFLHLAAFTRLKRDLAPGTDDLIDVFEANEAFNRDGNDPGAVYRIIARLARREVSVVQKAAEALVAQPDFSGEEFLSRLWEALKIIERFGVPVDTIRSWTGIVSSLATPEQRFAIARDAKEALKARFEPETWLAAAKPIFDRLRQRQRDALAAHVQHILGFERLEQLYEFFLIDPGMEPVVQTSRIRLAIAAVQLFIQRCLLNLEKDVHPSAILNAPHWEWMKRYRVWEANRKIFLYPENYLEPEFRDDRTPLFSELESALLQGDVSQDLVEDAFLEYLRKLAKLSRLDLVAMHLEQGDSLGQNVLHVFGRTFSQPHEYFYRYNAAGWWSPWQPVTAEIEGDHLAPVVWGGRLWLFWVTFMEKPRQQNEPVTIQVAGKPLTIPDPNGQVIDLEVRLNWSEYLNGEWSTRESSGFEASDAVRLTNLKLADIKHVFVHVSKEVFSNGEEGGVYIHLVPPGLGFQTRCVSGDCSPPVTNPIHGDTGDGVLQPSDSNQTYVPGDPQAFYLAGRNSSPKAIEAGQRAPANPYSDNWEPLANRYEGEGTAALIVRFTQRITTEPGKTPKPTATNATILVRSQDSNYTLLPCDNHLELEVPESAYKDADKPEEVKAALKSSLSELESLIKPVFYQDDMYTFFVEPELAERTVEQWEGWVPPTPPPVAFDPIKLRAWQKQHIVPQFPGVEETLPGRSPTHDWLVNAETLVLIDGQIVMGPRGQVPLTIAPAAQAISQPGVPVSVNGDGALDVAEVAILGEGLALEQVGLAPAAGGLHMVGAGGVNPAMMINLDRIGPNGSRAGVLNR